MAFGNYYGSLPAYQVPYYQPQPMMSQPMVEAPNFQQPTQRQTQTQTTASPTQPTVQTSVMWVANENEAKNAFVLANNTVLIMQNDMSRLYIKSADSIGRITFDVFDIAKTVHTPEIKSEPPQDNTQDIDLSKFITRDEIANLIPKNEDFVTHEELEEILKATKETTKKTTQKKEN